MLTVHHLGRSQSERIVWLCEELELPYKLVTYQRQPNGAAPPEYKALSAFGTAPVITDGDLALGESGAIVEYICRRHAGGRLILGPDHPDFANYLFWFHFANGSVIASTMVDHAVGRFEVGPKGERNLPQGDRTERAFGMIEERLGKSPFFAGDELTAADMMMISPLGAVDMYPPGDLGDCPNIKAYRRRIAERPAYQRALAKAPDMPMQRP